MPHYVMSKAYFEKLAHFRYQLRRFLRFSEDVARRDGVTLLQYLLLLQIRGFPGRDWATVGELAERLQAKHHGVVALVSRCESAGLVSRTASSSDKRRVEVRLTRAGNKCVERLAGLHRGELAQLRSAFALPLGSGRGTASLSPGGAGHRLLAKRQAARRSSSRR